MDGASTAAEREAEPVFAAAGRALAQAHRFEKNLKGLATTVHAIHTAGEGPIDLASFSKLSIGPLIDAARRFVDFDPKLEDDLEAARTLRNELCHAYFVTHADELGRPEGQRALVDELRGFEVHLGRCADRCSELLRRLSQALDASLSGAE